LRTYLIVNIPIKYHSKLLPGVEKNLGTII